jgi:hypothetical protein
MKEAMVAVFLIFVLIQPVAQSGATEYDNRLAEARSQIQEKRVKEAASTAERAIRLDKDRWEAYALAATAYSSQSLYDDAIGMLQLALPRAPEDKRPLIREALADARIQLAAASGPPSTGATLATASKPVSQPATAPTQAEIVLWKTIENGSNPEDLKAYLEKYPNGSFAPLAAHRLAEQSKPWTDVSSGLLWTRKDNGSDVNWNEATDYCKNLKVGSYSGWRLPEIDELAALYDSSASHEFTYNGKKSTNHVRGGIKLDASIAWSATKYSNGAWFVEFVRNVRFRATLDSRGGRALCVRSSIE